MTSFAASLLTFTQDSKILAVKKIKREQITLGAKNAQGDSEVDRSRSGMHFSSIPALFRYPNGRGVTRGRAILPILPSE